MMKIKRLVSVCTMTVMLACCGFSASARELFTDVPESEWAAPYIYNLADRGIIGGYGDGSFLPWNEFKDANMQKCLSILPGFRLFRVRYRRIPMFLTGSGSFLM